MEPCNACSGFGSYEVISGPGYVSVECETCQGMGEVDHNCPPDEICPECRSMPLSLLGGPIEERPLGKGWNRWAA